MVVSRTLDEVIQTLIDSAVMNNTAVFDCAVEWLRDLERRADQAELDRILDLEN